jgi:hypothetical protein
VVSQASVYDYTVLDQFGGVATSTTGAALSPATPIAIGFTRFTGFEDAYTLFGLADGHTNALKTTGADGGFYIKECNAVPQPFHLELSPDFDVNPVGTNHTVTATVTGTAGPGFPDFVPAPGVLVTFEIIGGVNIGASGTCTVNGDCTTDINGQASWTYTGSGGVGDDVIEASFLDEFGNPTIGNHAIKDWVADGPPTADARTIGFWKNHPNDLAQHLPLSLGPLAIPDDASGLALALDILNSASGKNIDNMLAAQLLAAKLNVAAGVPPCVQGAIDKADLRLTIAGYAGPDTTSPPAKNLKRSVNMIKNKLDEFNNNGCPAP